MHGSKPWKRSLCGLPFFCIFEKSGKNQATVTDLEVSQLLSSTKACTCGLGLALALIQVLQNNGSQMVVSRLTTLSARDCHWRNPRKKIMRVQQHKACVSVHWRAQCHARWPAGCYITFKHHISFASDLAANFGCKWFRIIEDTVSVRLLRAAIWSSCALWLESKQTPFPRAGRWFRSAALHRFQFSTCCFIPMSYVYSETGETNEWSKDWTKQWALLW